MKNSEAFFKDTLQKLLNERLSPAEAQSLKDAGFGLKRPTRKAAVMIALYKKAVNGDLPAIKELCGILGDGTAADGTVTILDDLPR